MLLRPLLTGYLHRLFVFLPYFEMENAIVSLEDKEVRTTSAPAGGSSKSCQPSPVRS
jgi:hypothetical protein